MSSIDQQFVEFVVKSLVSNPDAVKIDRRIDEKGVLLELTVDPEDLGRVIGKRGATAQSLRTLLRALGTKNDARYNLKIVDNGTGKVGGRTASSDDNERLPEPYPSVDSPAKTAKKTKKTEDIEEVEPDLEDTLSEDREGDEDDEDRTDRYSKTRRELEDLDDLDL